MSKAERGELSRARADNMMQMAQHVVEVLKVKNPKYGESWKQYEGFSAFMNLARKWSRLENLASKHNYDIFAAIQATVGEEDGMLEAMLDFMGYELLILDDQCVVQRSKRGATYPTVVVLKRGPDDLESQDTAALRDAACTCTDGRPANPECRIHGVY